MPRAARPTRLPGSGQPSPASEPDFFVKQGDFQALAAGRPLLFFRGTADARKAWEAGWREVMAGSFPDLVPAIDAAVGMPPAGADPGDAAEDGAG